MRLSAIAIAFASSLLLTTGAFADETATPAAPAATTPTAAPTTGAATPAPAATDVGDTVTCRYEARIGSNFKTRVCHTQREWKQMTTDSHDLMNRLDDHDRSGSVGGN
jgi:hypothetical protein